MSGWNFLIEDIQLLIYSRPSQGWRVTVHEQKKKFRFREMVGLMLCGFPLYNKEDILFSSPIGDALSHKLQ